MANVANDFRLKIKPEQGYPPQNDSSSSPGTGNAAWVKQDYGQLPFPYDIDLNSIQGSKNRMSMRIRIEAAYLHDAIPLIVGYGSRRGVAIPPPTGSALSRVLPWSIPMDRAAMLTLDPTKFWGMRAVDYSYTFEGETGHHGAAWQATGSPPSPWSANDFTNLPGGYDKNAVGGDFDDNLRIVKGSGSTPYGNPPISPDEPLARYRYAIITVVFAHLPYDVASDAAVASSVYGEKDRYVVGIFTPGYEYNTFRKGQLFWTAGPNSGNQVGAEALGGLVVSTGTVQLTWYRVPGASAINGTDGIKDCLDQVALYLNHVNAIPWAVPIFKNFRTFEAETLMFVQPSTPPIINLGPTGLVEADITFNFLYRSQGWNTLMNPADGKFYQVRMGSVNGTRPYPFDTDVAANGLDCLFLG